MAAAALEAMLAKVDAGTPADASLPTFVMPDGWEKPSLALKRKREAEKAARAAGTLPPKAKKQRGGGEVPPPYVVVQPGGPDDSETESESERDDFSEWKQWRKEKEAREKAKKSHKKVDYTRGRHQFALMKAYLDDKGIKPQRVASDKPIKKSARSILVGQVVREHNAKYPDDPWTIVDANAYIDHHKLYTPVDKKKKPAATEPAAVAGAGSPEPI